MAIQKNQAVYHDYHIAVSKNGKLVTTIAVRGCTVNDALKRAYQKACGWQAIEPENIDIPE